MRCAERWAKGGRIKSSGKRGVRRMRVSDEGSGGGRGRGGCDVEPCDADVSSGTDFGRSGGRKCVPIILRLSL